MRARRYASLLVALAGVVAMTTAGPAHAASAVKTQTISAPTGATTDRFGFAAAANPGDGNVALVGAPGSNPPTPADAGKAYVFTRKDGAWPLQQQLIPTPSSSQDFFGGAVDLSKDGNVALVGAPGNAFASNLFSENTSPGAAFIFTRHDAQWSQQAMLVATPAGNPGDSFGYSVALSDDGHVALVGAVGENGGQGAAYA